jgi:hypothetical protein
VASHTRGCSRGANNKPYYKENNLKSIFSSVTKALAKPRAPAPVPDFSVYVSHETLGHFTVAVCVMLVWYSVEEANSSLTPQVVWPFEVRAGPHMPA